MAVVQIKSYRKQREKEILKGLISGLASAGAIVEDQAKKNVSQVTGHPRVKSGRLRSSITHEVDEPSASVSIGTNVEYGKYLEFGTSRHPAYPWLFPAVEERRDDIIKALKGGFTIA